METLGTRERKRNVDGNASGGNVLEKKNKFAFPRGNGVKFAFFPKYFPW